MTAWIAAAALVLLVFGVAFMLRALLILSRRAERIEESLGSAIDVLGGISRRLSEELDREASATRGSAAGRATPPTDSRRQLSKKATAERQAEPYAPTPDKKAEQGPQESSPPPEQEERKVSSQLPPLEAASGQGPADHDRQSSIEGDAGSAAPPLDADATSGSAQLSKEKAVELFRTFRRAGKLHAPDIELMRMNWIGHVDGRLGETLGSFRVVKQVGDFLAIRRGNRAFVFPNPEVGGSAPDQDLVFPGYRESIRPSPDGLVDPHLLMARNDGTWVAVNE